MNETADLGLIGLAVMGQNLAMNIADHGFTIAVYDREASVSESFLAGPASGMSIIGADSVEELVALLKRPRRVMLMIRAGEGVDSTIGRLLALLDPGDIIIDGGNSHFSDTVRRARMVEQDGLLYVGTGVSGGEEGARWGPSIMPGGSEEAWPQIKDLYQAIAAKVEDGTPCCDWIGPDGAGHFVKMVHNGIEYGDMQLIAEAYGLMKGMGLDHDEMAAVFDEWSTGTLDSYLIEITAKILATKDSDGSPLVEKIYDSAGQKGTGKWTVLASLDLAQPLTLVAEAVFARIVSSLKPQRLEAAGILGDDVRTPDLTTEDIRDALYASKIVSYAQGFMLLAAASSEYGWSLDLGRIASLWREGCIIRAAFLDHITSAFGTQPDLTNLMLDPFFRRAFEDSMTGWRRTVAAAVTSGVPVPAYSTALAFFDSFRAKTLPANLIQAQRDFFGAHTYQRIDSDPDRFFHTNWTGKGGETTAGSYGA